MGEEAGRSNVYPHKTSCKTDNSNSRRIRLWEAFIPGTAFVPADILDVVYVLPLSLRCFSFRRLTGASPFLAYIGQILWATSILSLKVSVLCFYLHLFPERKFKLACYIVLGIMVVGGTGFILFDVLQCMPISAGWTLQHGPDAKCVKLSTVAISGAAFNVLSEIAILILPMPILSKLQLKKKKKIGVIVLLGLGFM